MKKLYSLFYFLIVYPIYKIQLGKIGFKSKIINPLHLDGKKNIYIGNNVLIRDKTWLAALPLTGSNDCKLEFHEKCQIGHFNHIYCTNSILFEKGVLTADKVYITDNLHQYSDINVYICNQEIKQLKKVVIGEGSWLGENVCIIGASVGKQSVIGANSVVTKDIPDYSVAVGSPAIIIKRYCFEKKEWLKTDVNGTFI